MPILESRIYGCWMGKSIGGTLGLPVEGQLGPLGLTFYEPVPTSAPPNDDLELQLVWLDLVERGSGQLTAADFAAGWLRHIHYMWDEYGRCRWNLRRGVAPEAAGVFENPFASGMGSPIRSEIWACLFADDPESAGYYAGLDASLDHGVEGMAGEVFCAVLQSLVAARCPIPEASGQARETIPASSETAQALGLVAEDFARGVDPWEGRRRLLQAHNHENFTHAPLNVALVMWSLLHGAGDFERSILLATNAGYDTDSTAATVGATLGLSLGLEALPARWKEPIGDALYVGPGIRDLTSLPATLQELTARTIASVGKLSRKALAGIPWQPAHLPALPELPGTISLQPLGDWPSPVPWANGDLPLAAKQAGGARWTWEVVTDEPRTIVCLARAGARLWIDDQLVIECPPGLPFVPAPHRCAGAARRGVRAGIGRHEVRVELNSREADQDAAVMLTYPDFHLCPWSAGELPSRAELA